MSYQDFCNTCRDLYIKKLYNDTMLTMFVHKGALHGPEYEAIIAGTPFSWETPVDTTEEENQNA